MGLDDQIGEFSLETGSPYNMVVDPVVIAAPGFAEQNAVVFETVFFQPDFRDLAVRFGPAGEKINDVAFVVPFVQHGQCIGVWQYREHALGFFIRHVVTNRAVDVDQKVADILRQYRADTLRRAGEILQEIERLQQELASLFGGNSGAVSASPRQGAKGAKAAKPQGKRRSMSPEARARIAAAARARWARYRSEKKAAAGK